MLILILVPVTSRSRLPIQVDNIRWRNDPGRAAAVDIDGAPGVLGRHRLEVGGVGGGRSGVVGRGCG